MLQAVAINCWSLVGVDVCMAPEHASEAGRRFLLIFGVFSFAILLDLLLRSQLAAARREIQWLLQQVGSPRSSGGGNQAEEQLRRENKSLLIEVEALRSIVQALRAVQIEPSSCDPPQPDVSQTRSQKHAAKKARIELQRDKVLLDISKGLDNIQDYQQTVKILHFCRDNRVEYDEAQDKKFRIGIKVQVVRKKSEYPSAIALAKVLLDTWAAEKKPEPR